MNKSEFIDDAEYDDMLTKTGEDVICDKLDTDRKTVNSRSIPFKVKLIDYRNELLTADILNRFIEFGYCEIDHKFALDRAKVLSPEDSVAISNWYRFVEANFARDKRQDRNIDVVAQNIIQCARKYAFMNEMNVPYAFVETIDGEHFIKKEGCSIKFTNLSDLKRFAVSDKGNAYSVSFSGSAAEYEFIVHVRCRQTMDCLEDNSKLDIDLQDVLDLSEASSKPDIKLWYLLHRGTPECFQGPKIVPSELRDNLKAQFSEIIKKIIGRVFFDNQFVGDVCLGISFKQLRDGKFKVNIESRRDEAQRQALQRTTTISYVTFRNNVEQVMKEALISSNARLKNFVKSFFMLGEEDTAPYLASVEAYIRSTQEYPRAVDRQIANVNILIESKERFNRLYCQWLKATQTTPTQNPD